MHKAVDDWVRAFVLIHGHGERVLEIGSRTINGEIRHHFKGCRTYVGIDIAGGYGVDVVADGASYLAPEAPDRVVSCEVLEHTPKAREIVENAWRQLAPGGWLVLTAASDPRAPHSAVDGGPLRPGEFYRNVKGAAIANWLLEIEQPLYVYVENHADRGDTYVLAQKVAPALIGE
jgi:hypothetical protein